MTVEAVPANVTEWEVKDVTGRTIGEIEFFNSGYYVATLYSRNGSGVKTWSKETLEDVLALFNSSK